MSTTLHSFIDIFKSKFSDADSDIQLNKIVIPIIQRDYAQGRNNPEVRRIRVRFLEALYDAVNGKPITLDFIYGDVDSSGSLIPLDGQQRLTTLFLLHWYAAKKEKVPESEQQFLKGFSYETRISSRDFCSELVEFEPSFDRSMKEDIINQPWFPLEWKKDPTIDSMLTMLDDVDEQFRNVPDLWTKLSEGAITFYLLPIKDMGLTDELYIKMNSRGKPLTQFEHFKAELEKEMGVVDGEMTQRIISKFDCEWMDLFWEYRASGGEEDNTTDDEFLRYFHYVCDVICFKSGESPQGRSSDALDLVHQYFSSKNPDARSNLITLEKAFSCWCDIPGYDSPEGFLESFMTTDGYEKEKIYVGSATLFQDCLSKYGETSGRRRAFTLGQFVLLYAVNFYLQHLEDISETEFIRRIRIINNLIDNSEDELVDRAERNRIPAILEQTEAILLTGLIADQIENSFNVNQLKEEKKKIEYLNNHPEDQEVLFRLEDSDMLYGQISIIGLDHLDLTDKFIDLFESERDWDKVDRALMATGNYIQQEQTWRYQAGSSSQRSAWYDLFHRSRNKGFENTGRILVELLKRLSQVNDENLDAVANNYIKDCESQSRFPWEYYYIKYPAFRPGSYGKLARMGEENDKYMYAVMQTRSNLSENTYYPYLMEADPDKVDREYKGQYLSYENQYIGCENDAFVIFENDNDEVVERLTIEQDENGIDTEDRIIKLKEYIKAHPSL